MHFYVYKITNKINNKVYIGAHKTSNLNDNYMGSGKIIKRAIQKHGLENFDKQILKFFESQKEMFDYEKLIVNEDFINSKNTYNVKLGGLGGWDFVNENYSDDYRKYNGSLGGNLISEKIKTNEYFKNEFCKKVKLGLIESERYKNYINSKDYNKNIKKFQENGTIASQSKDTKEKRSNTILKRNSFTKDKNSQYNKLWIYNEELGEIKQIAKFDIIPENWKLGKPNGFINREKINYYENLYEEYINGNFKSLNEYSKTKNITRQALTKNWKILIPEYDKLKTV